MDVIKETNKSNNYQPQHQPEDFHHKKDNTPDLVKNDQRVSLI